MNKCVLRDFLNSFKSLIFLILWGRLFHNLGPATLKALFANVLFFTYGIVNFIYAFNPRLPSLYWFSAVSPRYIGESPLRILYTITNSLNLILSHMGSQCKVFLASMLLSYFLSGLPLPPSFVLYEVYLKSGLLHQIV